MLTRTHDKTGKPIRLDRLDEKLRPRPHRHRTCGENFVGFEFPDVVNPETRRLEERLAERGAIMRRKVEDEAQRLKGSK